MSHGTLSPAPLRDFAIIVDARDNVAVAKTEVPRGRWCVAAGDASCRCSGLVTPGHRFATRAIPAGEFVRQYGQPIGTSRGIAAGDPLISRANMSNDVPVVRELDAELHTPPPDYVPEAERATFMGFRRPDGRVGTRNFVLIVPTSMCASHEATQIATIAEFTLFDRREFPNVDGVVAIPHNKGCGCSDGSNIEVMLRTLANYADHPNVGGVVFIGLGCEKTNLTVMEQYLRRTSTGPATSRPCAIGIQDVGGTRGGGQARRSKRWRRCCRSSTRSRARRRRSASSSLGVKCGGSDGFSGLSANPASDDAGDLADRAGRHRADHRGARVLRRRAHPRVAREGRRDRPRRLRRWSTGTRTTPRSSARCSTRTRARATSPAAC